MDDSLLGPVVSLQTSFVEDCLDLLARPNSLPIRHLIGSFFTNIIQNADYCSRLTNSSCGKVIKDTSAKIIACFSEELCQLGIVHVAGGVAQEDHVELLVVLPRKLNETGPKDRRILPQCQFLNLSLHLASSHIALVEHVDLSVSIGPEFKESSIAAASV